MVEPSSGVSSRRERNWEQKYGPVMSSTAELQRLRQSIQRLQAAQLVDLQRRWLQRTKQEVGLDDRAARNAMSRYGIRKSHDVMFLAHYAATSPAGPAAQSIAYAALAVGALPFGLSHDDYKRLIGPLAVYVPWLKDLA